MTNEKLLERARFIANEICGRHHFDIELIDDNKDYFDPMIVIDNVIGIYWNEHTRVKIPSLAHEIYRQGYQVCKIVHHSGVRYYPDGNGEPPSEDIEDIGDPAFQFDSQILEAMKLAMEYKLAELQEAEAERKLEEEINRYDDSYMMDY